MWAQWAFAQERTDCSRNSNSDKKEDQQYETYNDLISLIIELNYQHYNAAPEANKLEFRFVRFGLNYLIDFE